MTRWEKVFSVQMRGLEFRLLAPTSKARRGMCACNLSAVQGGAKGHLGACWSFNFPEKQ